jgi:dihydrofolate synthase/folylpolyglutamate synthase
MTEFDPIAYINEPRWQAVRLGLDRTRELLDRMGRPQDKLKFVHVAGTNGKGSTCAYIASILQAAGYRTGLFTSPYIIDFEERIRVDGVNIPKDDLLDITLFVREHAEAMAEANGEHPTEFELMTAVAFERFARSQCDVVVCEVGMGGRLDSTNIIDAPEVAVIVRLGLDHTDMLGDTIEAIAQSVGFKSRTSFVALFKKLTGLTPSAYQKMARQG